MDNNITNTLNARQSIGKQIDGLINEEVISNRDIYLQEWGINKGN